MDRLTTKGFNFDTNFVASNLQSWPIAQALKKLQAYEDAEEQQTSTCNWCCGDIQLNVKINDVTVNINNCPMCGRKLN